MYTEGGQTEFEQSSSVCFNIYWKIDNLSCILLVYFKTMFGSLRSRKNTGDTEDK